MKNWRHHPRSRFMLGLLKVYKLSLSQILLACGIRCRHHPSCSEYCAEAIGRHGFWPGGWMSLARFARCRPGGTAGIDAVPETIVKKHHLKPWRYGFWTKKALARYKAKAEMKASDHAP